MTEGFNYAGSRWWKFDFHCHTPASEDYGNGPEQEKLKNISPEDWLLNYMKAKMDCVAITDHNSGEWIDKLKNAHSKLKEEKDPNFRPIHIFPGVEISASGGVHILAILPENNSSSHIAGLLGAVGINGKYGSCDVISEEPVNGIISKIIDFNGIAIPAHVDDEKGIFNELSGKTLEKILESEGIFSMEVIDRSSSKPELYTIRKMNWTEIIGSDSHSPYDSGKSGDKYPGSHFTWVKMSRPTLEGLRLALLDGNDLSIKRSDEYSENPNQFEHLIVESISVENAHYMGNRIPFECKFNPWLNTVIGGRGIGKSTILEFMRLCLQRKDDVPDPIKNELSKYCEIYRSRDDDGLIRENTQIEVIVRKNRVRFKLIWNNTSDGGQIFEESKPGKWTKTEGNIKQRFPVNIFSQKQMFELAKDNRHLLKIIDESPQVDYSSWEKENIRLNNQYYSICDKIYEMNSDIKEESVFRGKYQDVNNKLKILEDSDHQVKLKQYEDALKKIKEINEWKKSWIGIKEIMSTAYEQINIKELDKSLFQSDSQFLNLIESTNKGIQGINEKITSITTEIETLETNWDNNYQKSESQKSITLSISEYEKLIHELKEKGIDDLNNYKELIEERDLIRKNLDNIEDAKNKKDEFIKEGNSCLEAINKHRELITKKRINLLNSVLQNNENISIEVIPYGNLKDIELSLRKIIGIDENRFNNDIECLVELVSDSAPEYYEGINKLRQTIRNIYQGELKAKDRRFADYLAKLDIRTIEELWCYYPEDTLEIKYYDENKNKLISITEGSPGQRTAAILAFFITYGNDPLILDQPEDDLDNQLIYNLIVSQIKSVKKSRQIIIVTHNANIVVNGDSENVIPLVSKSAQTAIRGHGGLQEKEVRKEVCNILEGGEKAFNMRYKRVNV